MICKTCGEDLTDKGMLGWATHPCNTITVKPLADGEMRTRMIELGFPEVVFEFFNFAVPTEMERTIFEEQKEEPTYTLYIGYEAWRKMNNK